MRASFIITTFNAKSTIKTILEQLILIIGIDDEIIVVDDYSEDETISIIEMLNNKRVKLIKSKHIGRAKALNKAINNSLGKFLFINDADDISSETRIKDSLRALENGLDAIFGNALSIDNINNKKIDLINNEMNLKNKEQKFLITNLNKNIFFKQNNFNHSTLAIKREKIFEIGLYDEKLEVCIDLDLYYRIILNKLRVGICNKIFITRTIGASRVFSKYPQKKYLKSLIIMRFKYRRLIKPSLKTIIHDIILIFKYLTK
jgi:glycosyltransferase involved in cell wall biosynthesis